MSLRRVQTLVKEYKETGKISKPKLRGRKIGEKKILSPEQERVIKRLITDKCPDQYKFECMLWTPNAVRELIFQRFGLKLLKQRWLNICIVGA
ncbi:MAG: hypothetical protein LBU04_04485 [Christensenellaceae bacterium]|nr:hypothetical protein [Christensenellaceae bacterium]